MGICEFIKRMVRAAMLDRTVYAEVEADEEATLQAVAVVVLVAVSGGLAGSVRALLLRAGPGAFVRSLVLRPIVSLAGYVFWALLTYLIGRYVFGGNADYGQMLRCIGFAYVPKLLGVISFIPHIGRLLALLGAIWALIAVIVAVREALDFDTVKAVLTCIVGWVAVVLLRTIVAMPFLTLGWLFKLMRWRRG